MFEQEGYGSFTAEVGGDFHCGPDPSSPKTFNWIVKVEWPDDSVLDEKGFLLDNMSFKRYFEALHMVTDSCEILVLKAAKHFRAKAPGAKVSVSIDVPGLARITNKQP